MPSPLAATARLAGAVSFAALLSACGTTLQSWNETVPCGGGTVTYRVRHFDTKTQMFVGFSEPYNPKLYQGIYADVEISNGDRFPNYYFAQGSNFRSFFYPLGTGNRVTIHCPGKTYVYATEDMTDDIEADREFSRNLADFNAGMKAHAEEKKRRDNELGYTIYQGKAILAERERSASTSGAAAGGTSNAAGGTSKAAGGITAGTTGGTGTGSGTSASTSEATTTPPGASGGSRAQALSAGQGGAGQAPRPTATTATAATSGTPGRSSKAAASTGSKASSSSTAHSKTSGGYLVIDSKPGDERKASQAQADARAKQAAADNAERDRAADAIRARSDAQRQADWERVKAELKARGNKQ
ncbi:MAG: hypothetical protein KF891_19775 [Rhizobacter sp.]|nr:hypothetical protein [Rhizobacter sp.]